jgi:linoleoyl-CoA desaturase
MTINMKTQTAGQDFLAIKYSKSQDFALYTDTLRQRIDQYFKDRKITRYGNLKVYTKQAFFLLLFMSSYALMLSGLLAPWGVFLAAMVFGITHVLVVMNIAHDAAHNALFRNRKLNRVFSWTLELAGLSHYLWKINHNIIHHPYPNVAPIDSELTIAIPFFRFSTSIRKMGLHKFQHLYAPLLYLFFTINLIIARDFSDVGIIPKKTSQQVVRRFSSRFYIGFILSKIFYFGYTLVVPMLVLDFAWWTILICYVLIHWIMSAFELCIQLPLHINEHSPVIEMNKDGIIENNWALQMLKSTTDYLPESKLANFITGGINTHTIHHFYPGICHIHYIPLTRILKQTSEEFNMPYNCIRWKDGVVSHFRQLKELALAS